MSSVVPGFPFAGATTRAQFVTSYQSTPFLVGDTRTLHARFAAPSSEDVTQCVPRGPRHYPPLDDGSALMVLPVRKVKETFPSMITIGRTLNNDLVLPDERVSRFHAYLSVRDGAGLCLTDAYSRNGTFVGGQRLVGDGHASIAVGDRLSIGGIELTLLDAAACWDLVRGTAATTRVEPLGGARRG